MSTNINIVEYFKKLGIEVNAYTHSNGYTEYSIPDYYKDEVQRKIKEEFTDKCPYSRHAYSKLIEKGDKYEYYLCIDDRVSPWHVYLEVEHVIEERIQPAHKIEIEQYTKRYYDKAEEKYILDKDLDMLKVTVDGKEIYNEPIHAESPILLLDRAKKIVRTMYEVSYDDTKEQLKKELAVILAKVLNNLP